MQNKKIVSKATDYMPLLHPKLIGQHSPGQWAQKACALKSSPVNQFQKEREQTHRQRSYLLHSFRHLLVLLTTAKANRQIAFDPNLQNFSRTVEEDKHQQPTSLTSRLLCIFRKYRKRLQLNGPVPARWKCQCCVRQSGFDHSSLILKSAVRLLVSLGRFHSPPDTTCIDSPVIW